MVENLQTEYFYPGLVNEVTSEELPTKVSKEGS